MNAKEFRREVGREIRRMYKLQKEHWSNGRRLYIRVLRTGYDMFGIDAEKVKILQSDPKLWKEAKIHLRARATGVSRSWRVRSRKSRASI